MPLLTVEGLILRNLRLGDTSRVVTVLSRELGRFAAVAKGVRAPRSRFGASLEILNLSSLVVYYRPGRDLQMISEGTLDREYRGLLRGAERYHHGCAVLEFLDRVLESEASVPELFKLSTRVLGLMEDAPRGRLRYLFRAFQLRAVGWLGYPPRVEGCTSCGRSEVVAFGPLEGGGCAGRAQRGDIRLCRCKERLFGSYDVYSRGRCRGLLRLKSWPRSIRSPRSFSDTTSTVTGDFGRSILYSDDGG